MSHDPTRPTPAALAAAEAIYHLPGVSGRVLLPETIERIIDAALAEERAATQALVKAAQAFRVHIHDHLKATGAGKMRGLAADAALRAALARIEGEEVAVPKPDKPTKPLMTDHGFDVMVLPTTEHLRKIARRMDVMTPSKSGWAGDVRDAANALDKLRAEIEKV